MNTVEFKTPTATEIRDIEVKAHQLRSEALREWFAKIALFFAAKPHVKTYAYDKAIQI